MTLFVAKMLCKLCVCVCVSRVTVYKKSPRKGDDWSDYYEYCTTYYWTVHHTGGRTHTYSHERTNQKTNGKRHRRTHY
jgi:hypothetical protein